MRLSFRYKIQLAVLGILMVTLASYIYLASQTLMSEKMASLFEAAGTGSELLAARVGRRLLAQQFWVESLLAQDKETASAAFQKNDSLLCVVQKKNGLPQAVFACREEFKALPPPTLMPKGVSVVLRQDGQNFWLTKSFGDGDFIDSLWSMELFQDEIRNYPEAQIFMVNPLTREAESLNVPTEFLRSIMAPLTGLAFGSSVQARDVSLGGKEFILGSAPVESLSVTVALALPKSLALEPVRRLQTRSIYFAIFVFGLTGLLALWMGKTLTQKLLLLRESANRIAKGDLDSAHEIRSGDEVGDLSRDIVKMAADLKRYIGEVQEKYRMESELKTARTVQDMLFPESSWSGKGVQVEGYYESASECGGDLWFFWTVDDYILLLVADATGHGVPAALMVSAARSIISAVEQMKITEPDRIISLLHEAIRDSSKESLLMTAWLARIHSPSGRVDFVNCSHEPVFQLKTDGTCKPLKTSNNRRIGDGQLDADIAVDHLYLQSGEGLLVYTDGLTDIRGTNGQAYGERRFMKVITNVLSQSKDSRTVVAGLVEHMKEFSGHAPLNDDLTVVTVFRS